MKALGIATVYGGIEYRSRLEARWAAFFDRVGWSHSYEPVDGGGYIPDFHIDGYRPLYVEIKPANTYAEYLRPVPKVSKGIAGLPCPAAEYVILGTRPTPSWGPSLSKRTAAGLIGRPNGTPTTAAWSCVGDDVGLITDHDFTLRPHGHPEDARRHPNTRKITEAWAWASNEVKWRGRAGA